VSSMPRGFICDKTASRASAGGLGVEGEGGASPADASKINWGCSFLMRHCSIYMLSTNKLAGSNS